MKAVEDKAVKAAMKTSQAQKKSQDTEVAKLRNNAAALDKVIDEVTSTSTQITATANSLLKITQGLESAQAKLDALKEKKESLLRAQKERNDAMKILKASAKEYEKVILSSNSQKRAAAYKALSQATKKVLETNAHDISQMPALSAQMSESAKKQFQELNVRGEVINADNNNSHELAKQLIEFNDKPIKSGVLAKIFGSNTLEKRRDAQTKLLVKALEGQEKELKAEMNPQKSYLKTPLTSYLLHFLV